MNRLKSITQIAFIREGARLLGLYWLYSSIRWLIARNTPYEAFQNALQIIHLERQLGIFYEHTIQHWLIDNALWFVELANTFYSLGYFPVLILTGVLLYYFSPTHFQIFKLTFLMGLGFALVCFSVFPLAPPRLMPLSGLIDTQQVYGDGLYNQKFVLSFYNPYAAMPSLHFGWALLVGIMACSFAQYALKLLGILYPCCMAIVIVTTGHHYILDIAGGATVVSLAFGLVKLIYRPAGLTPCVAGPHSNRSFGENKPQPPPGINGPV